MRWRRRIRVIDDCFSIEKMGGKRPRRGRGREKPGGRRKRRRRRRRGSENERGMKENLCGRRPPPLSPAIGFYVGARLQSPEKQICRTFRLKCQRTAGIDFPLSSEWGDVRRPVPYRTVFIAVWDYKNLRSKRMKFPKRSVTLWSQLELYLGGKDVINTTDRHLSEELPGRTHLGCLEPSTVWRTLFPAKKKQ